MLQQIGISPLRGAGASGGEAKATGADDAGADTALRQEPQSDLPPAAAPAGFEHEHDQAGFSRQSAHRVAL